MAIRIEELTEPRHLEILSVQPVDFAKYAAVRALLIDNMLREQEAEPLLSDDFRPYAEQVATSFFAETSEQGIIPRWRHVEQTGLPRVREVMADPTKTREIADATPGVIADFMAAVELERELTPEDPTLIADVVADPTTEIPDEAIIRLGNSLLQIGVSQKEPESENETVKVTKVKHRDARKPIQTRYLSYSRMGHRGVKA